MLSYLKNSVAWQFAAGFALGAAALAVFHPSEAKAMVAPTHLASK